MRIFTKNTDCTARIALGSSHSSAIAQDDLKFLRVGTRKHELLISSEPNYVPAGIFAHRFLLELLEYPILTNIDQH